MEAILNSLWPASITQLSILCCLCCGPITFSMVQIYQRLPFKLNIIVTSQKPLPHTHTINREIAMKIFGERYMNLLSRVFHWIIHERNPLLQIVYIIVVCGAFTLFIVYVWPYWNMFDESNNLKLSFTHIYASVFVMFACLSSWLLCCCSDIKSL